MNINKELKQIEKVGAEAWGLVMEGNFRAARKVISKIKNSFCVSESRRTTAIIEATILQSCNNQKEAKIKIINNLGYLWGVTDGFLIIAASNPRTDEHSSHYYIEILGGQASLGTLVQFTDRHIASFDVIANSTEEALSYVDEVANFADPTSKLVLTCAVNRLDSGLYTNRGVVQAYPFRIAEETCSSIMPRAALGDKLH